MRMSGRRRSWNAPFLSDLGRAEVGQEILAGVMGWQTVVTSLEFYASLFVSDDGSDKNATAEVFMLVAGMSTIVFGLCTNLPFIVAPSVLYVGRQTGGTRTMGGQLAAQALANAAAALVFWFALKLKLVSHIPTALRIGAGYGVAMLVGVLGMRNLGLLESDSFVLSTFTWESVVGLAVITAASTTTSPGLAAQKWVYVLGVPMIVTVVVYAVTDRSKFQGYASADNYPLSNWRDGSCGLVDFLAIFDYPGQYTLYIIRTFLSIVINILSVLLVLIDTVCLQRFRSVVKSAEDTDYSDVIGGTNKFRRTACAIPVMSLIGNLLGVTTQVVFVESMIVVFAGGKTGLSSVVTGSLFILSTVIWPLLPVIVPAHISGALTIVIALRFFTAVRVIDVARAENLLMFGVSILLIPFSFDFVDALCVATVLGFICTASNKIISRGMLGKGSKVAVSTVAENLAPETNPSIGTGGDTSCSMTRTKMLSTTVDGNSTTQTSLSIIGSDQVARGCHFPFRTQGLKGAFKHVPRNKSLPSALTSWTPTMPFEDKEADQSDAEEGNKRRRFGHLLPRFSTYKLPQPNSDSKGLVPKQMNMEMSHGRHLSFSSVHTSTSRESSSRRYAIGRPRRVKMGTRSRRIGAGTAKPTGMSGRTAPHKAESAHGPTVHWKLALIATVELVLKVVNDQRNK